MKKQILGIAVCVTLMAGSASVVDAQYTLFEV